MAEIGDEEETEMEAEVEGKKGEHRAGGDGSWEEREQREVREELRERKRRNKIND